MVFLKNLKKLFVTPWRIALVFVFFFGITSLVFATTGPTTIDPPVIDPDTGGITQGTVLGWGWMGMGITNPNNSEGGGGWLKFNCAPDDCGSSQWGVEVDLDENSSTYGYFSGEAWSNNFGWMTFNPNIVADCWEANPSETATDTAHILFPTGKVVGWAKFINGDDVTTDGYTGCVSFSGDEYGASVDMTTGAFEGWAWGSTAIGWISLQTPECGSFCDPTIVLDRIIGCMDPAATNYNPLATLPGRCSYGPIIGCMDPTATNYNPLATAPGRCHYGPPITGCMDPAATNYNPLATLPGRCAYDPTDPGGGRPRLTLDAQPISFTVGEPNVGSQYLATSLTWVTSNQSQIAPNSCSGTFSVNGTSASTLPGWTGARANPTPSASVSNVSLTSQASGASAGTFFRFTITCGLVGGGSISANDTIIMTAPIADPSSLDLMIPAPNNVGGLYYEEIPAPGIPVTLSWVGEEILWDSCDGSSTKYDSNGSPVGSNLDWDGSIAYNSGEGSLVVDMTSPNNQTTVYELECTGTSGNLLPPESVLVCITGGFCPTSGGGFPGYEEF